MPPALPIQRVHHIARVTQRPEASLAFYRDVLGFREVPRPPFAFRGAWLYNYGVQIHIIENPERAALTPDKVDTLADHVALEVEDIAWAKELLRQHGVVFFEQVNAGGIHQVFFQDPDGHVLEIATYPETPPEV